MKIFIFLSNRLRLVFASIGITVDESCQKKLNVAPQIYVKLHKLYFLFLLLLKRVYRAVLMHCSAFIEK